MGKAKGVVPAAVVVGVFIASAALKSGLQQKHPAAGSGVTATTSRSPAATVRPPPLRGGATCGASLALSGSGAVGIAVTCPGRSVRTASPSPGVVTITFRKDVSACTVTVTPHLAGLALGTPPGEVRVETGGAAAPGLITVRTFSHPGLPAARGFSLVLTCPA